MTRARKNLKYTFVVRKKRTTHHYFRHPRIGLKALPGTPGDAQFHLTYSRLLAQVEQLITEEAQRQDQQSVRCLVEAYLASDEFAQLRPSTRKDYSRELNRLCTIAGDLPFARITRAGALAMRKRVKADVVAAMNAKADARKKADADRAAKGLATKVRRKPPAVTDGARTADYFVSALSALLSWAVQYEHLASNPVEGLKRLKNKRNVESHEPWTEEQIIRVLAEAPPAVRDGVILGGWTGQRLADCVTMKKKRYIDPIVRIRQQKTSILVDVQAVGPLKNLLDRRTADDDPSEYILVQSDGKPYSERLFSEHIRQFLDSIGYDVTFHGLKYAAAGALNEAGCSVATITALIGNRTYQLALQYLARREEQKRVAEVMKLRRSKC